MGNYALCMITNDLYADGVCVDIYSFLAHNPWFKGDIVIIDYGFISDEKRKKLSAMYDKVKFKVATDERYHTMYRKVEELQKDSDIMIYAFPYIYKIEAFGLEGYDRVVFFDSDLVVFDDVRYLFENPYDFAVCRDDGPTTDVNSLEEHWRTPGELINSGVMSIKNPSKEMFNELIDTALYFEKTDIYLGLCYEQDSISTFLDRRKVRILPCTYNFPQMRFVTEGLTLTDQKIVHYYGPYKPWKKEIPQADYVNSFYNATLEKVNELYRKSTEAKRAVPLVFHLYLKNDKSVFEDNEIHRRILKKYRNCFSSATFVISADYLSSSIVSEGIRWIMSCGFNEGTTIKIAKNDDYREAKTFFSEIVSKLNSFNTPVFFAHNKGTTHKQKSTSYNVAKWTVFSYYSILRNFEQRVKDLTEHGISCGYIPVADAKEPWDYSTLNEHGWHVPGTILLLNPMHILEYIRKNHLYVPELKDYLSAEMFLGNVIDIRRRITDTDKYNILFENYRNGYFSAEYFNPYEVPHSELIREFLPEETAKQYDDFFKEICPGV